MVPHTTHIYHRNTPHQTHTHTPEQLGYTLRHVGAREPRCVRWGEELIKCCSSGNKGPVGAGSRQPCSSPTCPFTVWRCTHHAQPRATRTFIWGPAGFQMLVPLSLVALCPWQKSLGPAAQNPWIWDTVSFRVVSVSLGDTQVDFFEQRHSWYRNRTWFSP